jgi:hypothetical protein
MAVLGGIVPAIPHQTAHSEDAPVAAITPIFVSVKESAQVLGITEWSVYDLLNKELIECRYHGRRRLVSYESLKAYADSLPKTAPEAVESA